MTARRPMIAKVLGLAALLALWQVASAALGTYWVPGLPEVGGRARPNCCAAHCSSTWPQPRSSSRPAP
ncbi:hypothetical protein HK414_24155 [Ramlibacter terrae]|uniref:Uncharacterized protein n=1 Tax=Ramlibacter terrae TaxID=2732511 RepID=A0ABX6P5I9_9BURK|nr:hypothetical protein HK414_24155 [Ramlibacter terrae]